MPANKQKKLDLPKKKPGRPCKLFDENKKIIFRLAARGFDDADIAEVVGVDRTTICNWKNKYPDFFDTLKIQKEMADHNVKRALFERACGYEHEEDKIFCNADGDVTTVKTIKHYPPDPTSMIFWLKNRDKENWRDKHDLVHTGDLTVEVVKFGFKDKTSS